MTQVGGVSSAVPVSLCLTELLSLCFFAAPALSREITKITNAKSPTNYGDLSCSARRLLQLRTEIYL